MMNIIQPKTALFSSTARGFAPACFAGAIA